MGASTAPAAAPGSAALSVADMPTLIDGANLRVPSSGVDDQIWPQSSSRPPSPQRPHPPSPLRPPSPVMGADSRQRIVPGQSVASFVTVVGSPPNSGEYQAGAAFPGNAPPAQT